MAHLVYSETYAHISFQGQADLLSDNQIIHFNYFIKNVHESNRKQFNVNIFLTWRQSEYSDYATSVALYEPVRSQRRK